MKSTSEPRGNCLRARGWFLNWTVSTTDFSGQSGNSQIAADISIHTVFDLDDVQDVL